MISTFKNIIPLSYKERFILYKEAIRNHNYKHLKNEDKVLVFMAADYKNIGDAAITYAQVNMLKHIFPDKKVIEIPMRKSFIDLLAIKKNILNNDIITTIGGGNMGDVYYGIERIRQQVINTFKKNRIISFPQSYNFLDDKKDSVLHSAKDIYQRHENLLFLIRDEGSYERMKHQFKNLEIKLCPDIVLTLDLSLPILERKGLLLMLRNDKESILTENEREAIKLQAVQYDNALEIRDTSHHDKMIDIKYRNKIFLQLIAQIKQKKVVITDRLHGVIFCYITKTPCIAINSHNSKVKNTVNTYMKCDYIKLIDGYDSSILNQYVDCLMANRNKIYTNNTQEYFNQVCNIIKNEH